MTCALTSRGGDWLTKEGGQRRGVAKRITAGSGRGGVNR